MSYAAKSKTAVSEVGVAYVTILPNMSDFQKTIRKAMVDALPKSWKEAFEKSGAYAEKAALKAADAMVREQQRAEQAAEKAAQKAADAWVREQERAEQAAEKAAEAAIQAHEKATEAAIQAHEKATAQAREAGISGAKDLVSRIGNMTNGAADKFIEMGRAAGQRFMDGFNATYGRVGSLMTSIASSQVINAGQALGLKFGDGIASGLSTAKLAIGNAIGNIISSAVSAVTGSISSAIGRVDTMASFPRIMANMNIGAEESEKAIQQLSDAIDGLPTRLDDAARGTQRLVAKNGDIEKSVQYFTALNNAILAGGAGADIQASAIEQLTQSYAKGQMDMMEWRTLQMAMPAQLNQVAKAMGMTTEQLGAGLRRAEKDAAYLGNIDMSEFMDALVQLNTEGVDGFASFAEQAKTASHTIGVAITNIANRLDKASAVIIEWVGQESIFNSIESVTSKFIPFANEVVAFLERINLKEYVGVVGTRLADAFDRLKTAAEPAMATLEPLTQVGMREGYQVISDTLDHIVDKGTPFIEKVSGTLQDLLKGAPQISDSLQPVIDAFVDMKFDTWGAALDMWQKIADAVLPVLPEIIDATSKVNTTIADIVGKLAGPAADAFSKIYGIVADLIQKNAPIITIIGTQLSVTLPKMAQQIADMVNAVAPFLPQVMQAFDSMVNTAGPAITDIVNTLAPHLPEFADTIAAIVNSLVPAVKDLVDKAEPFISPALDLVKQVGTFVGDHLEGILLMVAGIKAASAAISGISGLASIIQDITAIKGLIAGEGGLLAMITSGASSIGGAISGAAEAGAGALAGLLTPPVGIVVGIAAAAVAALWFFNCTETGRQMWGDFTNWLGEKVEAITGWFTSLGDTLIDALGGAFKWLEDKWKWFDEHILQPEWDWVSGIVSDTPSQRQMASGGIAYRPTNALIAEAGTPEAVVPLSAQGIRKFTSGLSPQYAAAGSPSVEVHIDTFMNYDTDRDVRSLSEEIGRDTLRQLKMQGVYA